jgi:hypothetical protein
MLAAQSSFVAHNNFSWFVKSIIFSSRLIIIPICICCLHEGNRKGHEFSVYLRFLGY